MQPRFLHGVRELSSLIFEYKVKDFSTKTTLDQEKSDGVRKTKFYFYSVVVE